MLFKFRLVFFFAFLSGTALTLAISDNTVYSTHEETTITINTSLDIVGNQLFISSEVPRKIEIGTLQQRQDENLYQQYVVDQIAIANDNRDCDFKLASFVVTDQKTTFGGTYTCPTLITSIDDLAMHASLYSRVFPIFNHIADITLQSTNKTVVFTQDNHFFPDPSEAQTSATLIPTINQSSLDNHQTETREESDEFPAIIFNFIRNHFGYIVLAILISVGIIGAILFYKRKIRSQ